jgi:hypothetical protein
MSRQFTQVKDIVKQYLEINKNNYDGLCNDSGECACLKSDLAPCGNMAQECMPGYIHSHSEDKTLFVIYPDKDVVFSDEEIEKANS